MQFKFPMDLRRQTFNLAFQLLNHGRLEFHYQLVEQRTVWAMAPPRAVRYLCLVTACGGDSRLGASAPSRHISPIFGILGERLCGVRGFTTVAIAVAMAAGGKFRTPCKIRRETK
jgi:hypothetical protein